MIVHVTRAALLAAIQAWLVTTTQLQGARVYYTRQKGLQRPTTTPFITIDLTTPGVPIGEDEDYNALRDVYTLVVEDGIEDDPYTVEVDGTPVTHVRTLEDTNATVATALAELLADEAADAAVAVSTATLTVTGAVLVIADPEPLLTLDVDDELVEVHRGRRRATLSINGYGAEAYELLEDARLGLRRSDVMAALDDAGVAVVPLGGISDLSDVLDDSFEARCLLEVEARFVVESAARPITHADQIQSVVTLEGEPTDRIVTTTVDVTP